MAGGACLLDPAGGSYSLGPVRTTFDGRALRVVCVASLASPAACSLENALNADTAPATSTDGGASSGQSEGTATGADATGQGGAQQCAERIVRVATQNVESIGAVGSEEYDALGSIVLRIAPDVMCFQEVQFDESAALGSLATEAGYDYVVQANRSPAIGGDHTNACIANVPLELVGSFGGRDLSSDFDANDVGRDILAVRAFVGAPDGIDCHVGVLTVHLKSGQEPVDLFRRQVEIQRLRQALDRYRESYPGDPLVVMGDFNESLDDPGLGATFETMPPGLPGSYQLGADLSLPITYQPFASLQSEGFELSQPTQEDSTDLFETWGDSVRLDYLWFAGAVLLGDEVYNSCRDDGVDEAPAGNMMEKAGGPLPCGVSVLASDHFAVFGDLELK